MFREFPTFTDRWYKNAVMDNMGEMQHVCVKSLTEVVIKQ